MTARDSSSYKLSVFPTRPGMEAPSARVAWQIAWRLAVTEGRDVWFTADGATFSPASQHPPDVSSA